MSSAILVFYSVFFGCTRPRIRYIGVWRLLPPIVFFSDKMYILSEKSPNIATMNYDFSILSDIEFEQLVNKLLTGKARVVEQYAEGRDNGIDGLARDIPNGALIQAKHYLRSGFNKLKSKIEKEELPKIQKKSMSCYVLATSLNLSQGEAEILRTLIQSFVQDVIVLGAVSISSLLDNNPATLKSTVKLWATNAELVRQILKPSNINCFYELQNRWEDLNRVFVETPDIKNVVDSLEKNHVAVIAGEPGVGKTTLAEYICLLYFKEGFEIHFFEGDFSHDDYDLSNPEKKIIFYFDDFLGSTYYNCFSGKQDSSIVNLLNRISKEKNKRFILTSRTNIIHKACLYSQKYQDYRLAKQAYIVNVGSYSESIKASILYNHLRYSNLNVDEITNLVKNKMYWTIIQHHNFNPRLIHFITKQENFEDSEQRDYLEFINDSLNNPKAIWGKCFTKQLDNSQRLLVQLVVANGGEVPENVLKNAYKKALLLMDIKTPEQERNDYEYVLSVCLKSILKKSIDTTESCKEPTVAVFNPSVSDYVLPTILDTSIITKLSTSLDTVESLSVIESNEKKFDDVHVIYRNLLANHLKRGWSNTKIHLVCLLGAECGLISNLIKSVIDDNNLISLANKNDFYFIVSENIDTYDFSEFIKRFSKIFCNDYQDFGSILEYYKECPFVKEDVIAFLQKCIYESLKDKIQTILLEQTFASDTLDLDNVNIALENLMQDFQADYPFLTNDEINDIWDNVDAQQIVDENRELAEYEVNKDYLQKVQKNINDIDALFDQLL